LESQFWRRCWQTFSTGFSSGDRRDIVGHVELARRVPSGPVEDENGMGARSDVARDFIEVKLYHVGVGVGQHEGRPDAAGRADRAEQIGAVVALVGGLPWPRSAPGPLPNLAVLLADAALIPSLSKRTSSNQISTGAVSGRPST
jgi:hypothetical protein